MNLRPSLAEKARAKTRGVIEAEQDRIALLPRAQRRAAMRRSMAYRITRAATRHQRRAFGGWPSSSRPGHASVRS